MILHGLLEDCDAETLKIRMLTVRWYYKLSQWMTYPAMQNVITTRHILKHGNTETIFPEHSSMSIISNPSTQVDALCNVL